MPFRMGPMEIALILLIVLIVFGVGKLPQVGGVIGRGIREFRKAQRGDYDEADEKSPKGKGSADTGRPANRDKDKED
jgi:sec-independent protein translocase protein TatA